MCLNQAYSRVRVGKDLSDTFPTNNDSKQGGAFKCDIPVVFYE